MSAGRLRDRVTFQESVDTPDAAGGVYQSWRNVVTVWGALQEERGRERVEAGRLESGVAGILTVRSSSETRDLGAANRVVVNEINYQIRSISNPDRRNKYLELVVERGGGT